MASLLKNWVVLIKKYEKKEAKWKDFNQCKHFVGGLYMFISTSERSLDFVLVVYDLIELIIETSC